jgi:hypothetical protein
MSRASFVIAIFLAALVASYGVLALREDGAPPPPAAASSPGVPGTWVLEDVHLRTWEGARQTVDARAARIEVRPKRAGIFTIPALRETRVSELDARISKSGGDTTRVRAERASIDPFRRFWVLEGNARIEEAGTTLACAKIKWDPSTGPLPSSRCRPLTSGAITP